MRHADSYTRGTFALGIEQPAGLCYLLCFYAYTGLGFLVWRFLASRHHKGQTSLLDDLSSLSSSTSPQSLDCTGEPNTRPGTCTCDLAFSWILLGSPFKG